MTIFDFLLPYIILEQKVPKMRTISSAGRAFAWRAKGQRFEPVIVHHSPDMRTGICFQFTYRGIYFLYLLRVKVDFHRHKFDQQGLYFSPVGWRSAFPVTASQSVRRYVSSLACFRHLYEIDISVSMILLCQFFVSTIKHSDI